MLIIAHRGASKLAPENTLAAIEQAVRLGVDAIEVDVHHSEHELVVIHDRWLHRTTNGQGRIQDHSFVKLRELDAGSGERIPTLWEVMTAIHGRCDLNIELKGIQDVIPVLTLVDKAVAELDFRPEQFLLSAFNHHLLFETKRIRPEMQVGALTASCPLDYANFGSVLGAYSVHICMDAVTQPFVEDAHSRGLAVYVYTVDEPEDMHILIDWGVDGIFTNRPDTAMNVVAKHSHPEGVTPAVIQVSEDHSSAN
ncbi:Glycerophosphodiester phosphodiesterase [Saliniradius amylolyticus]|uniref:Glycerophosphodiester phosphodiesterase n=1 Tax=Saliniradius amylolyticus TaxID=2183582 RepID=A0A2S2E8G1_9ALTE|nr:glycerophosphodiester phosphodiesterase family protein [Saliniradius amylolyticus]AWL13227.1 Glycerophosphodiester phosphodiesterase [Saliniradius amylolyticus]